MPKPARPASVFFPPQRSLTPPPRAPQNPPPTKKTHTKKRTIDKNSHPKKFPAGKKLPPEKPMHRKLMGGFFLALPRRGNKFSRVYVVSENSLSTMLIPGIGNQGLLARGGWPRAAQGSGFNPPDSWQTARGCP